jgi:hypothetical protein
MIPDRLISEMTASARPSTLSEPPQLCGARARVPIVIISDRQIRDCVGEESAVALVGTTLSHCSKQTEEPVAAINELVCATR